MTIVPISPTAPVRAATASDGLLLSIVVPVFNEADVVDLFLVRLESALEKARAALGPGGRSEILFVDDGSLDGTAERIAGRIRPGASIRLVQLSRNFGKDAALAAGLAHARGDAVVPMDADLQDPPELLERMVVAWRDGATVVNAVRMDRQSDSWFKRTSARLFYGLFNHVSTYPLTPDVGDFRLLDRSAVAVAVVNQMPERIRFMKGLFSWIGFKQVSIGYTRAPRIGGTSKWRPWSLWNFALDGITGSTTLPLRIWTYAGATIAVGALAYAGVVVVRTLVAGIDVPGYASLLTVVLTLGALNLLALGMIGEYVGRTRGRGPCAAALRGRGGDRTGRANRCRHTGCGARRRAVGCRLTGAPTGRVIADDMRPEKVPMTETCAPAVSGTALGLRARLALIAVLLAVPVLFAVLGTPQGHSYGFNLSWHVAFEAAQAQGAIYPRHLPDLNYGLGGFDFFFYGPLPFFLAAGPAAWLCPGCAPQTVFGLAGGILLSASMLAFWPLARRVAPPMATAIGCVVYGFLPYHLGIDWGLRQAAGEFAAYAFLPLAALGQMDWLSRGRPGLAFPMGLAGVILCHLPTALLSAHVFGVIALVWAVSHPRAAVPRLAGLAGMGLAGVALAGLYWLPAMVLLGDVSPEALYTAFHLPQMWLLPMDGPMPNPGMTLLSVGTALAGAVLSLVAIAFAPREGRHTLWLWTALPIVIVLFLNSRASVPIWDHWVIDRVQFPFRLFVFSDLATALAAAALARHLVAGRPRTRRVTAAVGLSTLALCALVGVGLSADRVANGIKLKGTTVRMIAPIEYHPPALAAAVARAAAAAGYDDWRIIRVIDENLDAFQANAAPDDRLVIRPRRWDFTPEAPGAATLPVPYWRHMRAATATGEPIALAPEPLWGRVTFEVPAGAPPIIVRLPLHWSEWTGITLSLAGLAGCVGIGALGLRKTGDME